MLHVLHIYDNESVMLTCKGVLPDERMTYCPREILDLSPDVFEDRQFNLIIFDVSKEGKSHLALFKKLIRWIEISGATRPPILVITKMDSELTEQAARMEGADFFFTKPVDRQELVFVFQQIASHTPP